MAKVMLVEDDNNLREIYEARLLAEGYEIISAHDGEEALALAVREKPDLIISDVMMPKISGFDMLDILRGSPETKNTKVIMMTALSQIEDKDRADKLGADRYLVKSQVTLEDVVRVAHEVLEGTGSDNLPDPVALTSTTPPPAPQPAAPVAAMPVASEPPSQAAAPEPTTVASGPSPAQPAVQAVPEPSAVSMPVSDAPAVDNTTADPGSVAGVDDTDQSADNSEAEEPTPEVQLDDRPTSSEPPDLSADPSSALEAIQKELSQAPTSESEQDVVQEQIEQFEASPAPDEDNQSQPEEPNNPSVGKKVIQPINDLTAKPDLNALLAKEEEKEKMAEVLGTAGVTPMPPQPVQQPSAQPGADTASPQPAPAPQQTPEEPPKPGDPSAIAL